MGKKTNWLDAFAEAQAKKLEKTASVKKEAQHYVVDPEDLQYGPEDKGPICEGKQVKYKGEKYIVVNANFSDELGKGVVLEKYADDESVVPGQSLETQVSQSAPNMGSGNPMEPALDQNKEQGGNEAMDKEGMKSKFLKKLAEDLFKKDEELEDEDKDEEELEEVKDEDTDEFEDLDMETGEPLPEEPEEEMMDESPMSSSAPMGSAPMGAAAPMGAPAGKGQEYARQQYQGPIYDIDVRSVEQSKFEGEAAETANKINSDNSVDRTSVQGRYSNNSILNSIVNAGPMEMEMGTGGYDKVAPEAAPAFKAEEKQGVFANRKSRK